MGQKDKTVSFNNIGANIDLSLLSTIDVDKMEELKGFDFNLMDQKIADFKESLKTNKKPMSFEDVAQNNKLPFANLFGMLNEGIEFPPFMPEKR